MSKEQKVSSRFKQAGKIALALILSGLFVWGIYEVWERWAEIKSVTSAPGIIVFETGGLSLGGAIGAVIFGLVVIISALSVGLFVLPSELRNRWSETHSVMKTIKTFAGWSAFVMLLLVGGAMPIYFNGYYSPVAERVVVNRFDELISVERDYIFRTDESLHVTFAEVDYIKYERAERTVTEYGGTESYGTVSIIKPDGTEFEIHRNGPTSTYNLAKAIVNATGKPLVREP